MAENRGGSKSPATNCWAAFGPEIIFKLKSEAPDTGSFYTI
jgi:hypothetical protein